MSMPVMCDKDLALRVKLLELWGQVLDFKRRLFFGHKILFGYGLEALNKSWQDNLVPFLAEGYKNVRNAQHVTCLPPPDYSLVDHSYMKDT